MFRKPGLPFHLPFPPAEISQPRRLDANFSWPPGGFGQKEEEQGQTLSFWKWKGTLPGMNLWED